MSAQWCTIESDPGVFTELISKFGVKGVQVEEFFDLEDSTFERLNPVYGLIFLFKYDKKQALKQQEDALDIIPEGLFFAKQVINNACATQAILGVLLNCRDRIELGNTLNNFYNFTKDLDSTSRGMALENSDEIRTSHNSFAPSDPIEIEQIKDEDEEGEDAFHFVSYVPYNGFIYEIDGLQKGPRLITECTDKDWFQKLRPTIQERMQEYNDGEMRFTLLGIIQDLKTHYENDLKKLEAKLNNSNGMNVDDDEFDSLSIDEKKAKMEDLKSLINEETLKRQRWQKENVRRHHNYFPFIFAMLKVLSENNVLDDLTKRAEEKKKVKLQKLKERKEQEKQKEKDKTNGKDNATSTSTSTTTTQTNQ